MPPHRPARTRRVPEDTDQPVVTRGEFRTLLDLVEKNTLRISRLEDIFALQDPRRAEVATELQALKKRMRRRRRRPPVVP
jgi:hypothetical protein